jgi:serine kinase of HPr protein (carbohydrate metabolism regulator)
MSIVTSETIHASTVAIGGIGVLITGRSGSGKSDLALRLIDRGAVLVSDDYTILTREGDRLIASAPSNIRGKIEVHGVGLVDVANTEHVPARLVISLDEPVTRFPELREARTIIGVALPVAPFSAFEASTPIKVELALKALTA